MQILCESCSATYLVDDEAVTPRGVRAQCPHCQRIQLVGPPSDSVDSVDRPPVPGVALEPEPDGRSQVARVTLATRILARPPVPPPEAMAKEGPEARAELFGELSWEEGEPPGPGDGSDPLAAQPALPPDPLPAVVAPARPPPPPAPPPEPPGEPQARATVEAASDAGGPARSFVLFDQPPEVPGADSFPGVCASCGGGLPTEEDQASGVCTPCREGAAARLAPPLLPVPPPPSSSEEVTAVSPVPPEEVAAVPPVPPEEAEAVPPLPPPESEEGTDGEVRPAPPTKGTPPSVRSARLPARDRPVWMVVGLLVVVICGLAAVLWFRGLGRSPNPGSPPRSVSGRTDPEAPLPAGLAERIAAWRKAAPAPALAPRTALVEAQREIALDQPAAYASARARLEAALVERPRDPELLGAWLTAVALGRGATLASGELQALTLLGESAVVTTDRAPAVLVGLAEVLLARPGPGPEARARELAQESLASDGWHRAQARLILARTYMRTSGVLALTELQGAERLDPTQRRIHLIRAEVYTATGEPRAALAALQARLALEPDHAASLFAMGRLLVEVGETEQARRLFERLQADPRTQDGPALLALAALECQVQSRPQDAIQLLRGALRREHLQPAARVQAQVQLARAAQAVGDLDGAAAAAQAALALDPAEPGGHLVLLLIALDRGDGAAAAAHLPSVLGRLDDPGLEGLLEGRVRLSQGQLAEAADVFERTARTDPRRTDALLWAAAARASVPDRARALGLASTAAQADPTRAGPWVPLSTALRPEDGLKGAEGRLAHLSHGDGDGQPLLDEAVLRFHRRDLVAAEAALMRALRADASQSLALAWHALLLLERGDVKGASAAAAAALQSGRALALPHYAAGVAALAAGDLDAARRWLREAVQLAPTLLAAEVKLAEVEVRAGAVPAARERLRKVVQLDPSYASAKRALYLLPPEN